MNLLIEAKKLGLIPYGISFNVGSQARNSQSWSRGIRDVSKVMKMLLKQNIKIQAIDLGGGFPFSYQAGDGFPDIQNISKNIKNSVNNLPYKVKFIAEPGRGLVANAYVLIATVIGKASRKNGDWLYLDAGVYNGLLESLACQGSTRYKISCVSDKYNKSTTKSYILTGPTGDNIDVISRDLLLPQDISIGDKVIIKDVGAYSFTLITPFNGFPKPSTINL